MTLTSSIFLSAFMFLIGCKENQEKNVQEAPKADLIKDNFPDKQQEVKAVLDSLFVSIQNREIEELLSYHLYSDKFTEFTDGLPRTGSIENEENERQLIENIAAFNYDLGALKIDVFDDVAIVTFNADFRPKIGDNIVQLWRQGTIVFVKYNNVWRITHEHFSPINVEDNEK